MSTYNIKQAKTPKTGTSRSTGLRLKKAALACYLALFPYIGRSKGSFVVFGATAMIVPPPFGFVSGVLAAVAFNISAAAGGHLLKSAQDSIGFVTRHDLDILAQFNRLQQQGPRQVMTLPSAPPPVLSSALSQARGQKTVFPVAEMR